MQYNGQWQEQNAHPWEEGRTVFPRACTIKKDVLIEHTYLILSTNNNLISTKVPLRR